MELKRLLAFIIDLFIVVFPIAFIGSILGLMKIKTPGAILPWLSWGALICKDCFAGRSIGKRILGYQVVNLRTGQTASPFKCVARNLLYLLGIIDIIFMFYKSGGRRLGDYITNTQVINYDKASQDIRWREAILSVACVFAVIILLNALMTYYASSLGLWGLLYR